jgi:alpha-D-ribose 1-methylphosphonate 5-triphosphate synthase subunit PhnH
MTKVESTFDIVYDTQMIYRKILDSMARPGKINHIQQHVKTLASVTSVSSGLIGIALTLIDREVTFHLKSGEGDVAIKYLQRKTFSRHESLENAQFVFIEERLEDDQIREVMSKVNCGTLLDPHDSATIILQVKNISNFEEGGTKLRLQGPGIKAETICYIDGLSYSWMEARNQLNKEYPIGVDMIFISDCGDLMAIPRTTKIESEDA